RIIEKIKTETRELILEHQLQVFKHLNIETNNKVRTKSDTDTFNILKNNTEQLLNTIEKISTYIFEARSSTGTLLLDKDNILRAARFYGGSSLFASGRSAGSVVKDIALF